MNLFRSTSLIQVIREEFDLIVSQAVCVLIAYQHGTISTLSAQEALGFDARRMSSEGSLSGPVRKKILKEVGKTRVKHGSRPSTIYALVDPVAMAAVINAASEREVDLYHRIASYEETAQKSIKSEG
jgi:hypothetical protein